MAFLPATLVATLGSWLVASILWIGPHSLSYFNELIGGPLNGPKHLLGSNVDWGQDLRYLCWWEKSQRDVVRIGRLAVSQMTAENLNVISPSAASRNGRTVYFAFGVAQLVVQNSTISKKFGRNGAIAMADDDKFRDCSDIRHFRKVIGYSSRILNRDIVDFLPLTLDGP